MKKSENILVIGDTHIPYEHKDYLSFCKEIYKKHKCSQVIHIGDVVDLHSINYHEHIPELASPEMELDVAIDHLQDWYKAFPKVKVCIGNHDALPRRKFRTNGLPLRFMKEFREIFSAPDGWTWHEEVEIFGVLFKHTLFSGYTMNTLLRGAEHYSQSVVCGHAHSVAGVSYSANNKALFFAMAVGCGIDRRAMAFDYGELNRTKPIISCGVVLDNGKTAIVEPMSL